MIKVWTDGVRAGLIDRNGQRGSTFAYRPGISDASAVSVTMPVRLPSWNVTFGLAHQRRTTQDSSARRKRVCRDGAFQPAPLVKLPGCHPHR